MFSVHFAALTPLNSLNPSMFMSLPANTWAIGSWRSLGFIVIHNVGGPYRTVVLQILLQVIA